MATMELVINPHPVLGAHIQHTLPSTLFYPGKDSPWQPVVTSMASLASMANVPKESIIANTDFTTTSVIAKRRLSSKKRKKLENQQSEGPDARSTGTPSPTSHTPTITSTTGTSPPPEKGEAQPMQVSHSAAPVVANGFQPVASSVASSSSGVTRMVHQHTHTHTHTHHIAPPPSQAGGVPLQQPLPGGQYHVPLAAQASSCYPVAPSMMPSKQFADPVLNHLQQELNYRFLQEQSGALVMPPAAINQLAHPQPHPQPQAQVTKASNGQTRTLGSGAESGKPTGFKWCCAHVIIAKQIQQHQEQAKAVAVVQSKEASRQHSSGQNTQSDLAAQQQQLALLQMYGLQPNAAAVSGYMAVPYSMQEVQMRMQSFVQPAPLVSTAGISLVKQAAGVPNQMVARGALESDPNLNAVHMMSGIHLQQAPFAHVPMAALAPSDLSMHGSTAGGSWVTPVPVIGSCIINPFQPGIMPTSWVK